MWLSHRSYFCSEALSSPLLAFSPLWSGRLWCVPAVCVRMERRARYYRYSYLKLKCPTSRNYFGDLLCLPMCCLWLEQSSFPPFLSYCLSVFTTRTATFDTGVRAGSARFDGGSVLCLRAYTDSHKSHKPKCADFRDQNRIRSYFAFVTFWVLTFQAHKQKPHKETTVNRYNTILLSYHTTFLSVTLKLLLLSGFR